MHAHEMTELEHGVVCRSVAETHAVARLIAHALPDGATLALHGDLGAGKTSFVQGLAHAWGIGEPVTSPSFNICCLYRGKRMLAHVDAYRLADGHSLDDLMLEELLQPPCATVVEWPERVADWLPADAWHLYIHIGDQHHRHIRLERPQT